MSLKKCYGASNHYCLSSLIICVILIGFSFPAMAYQIQTFATSQFLYNVCHLEWDEDNGYSKQYWEADNYIGAYFEVVPDPGDPTNLGTPFEVKITYTVRQQDYWVEFYNFVNYPEYEVFYAGAPISGSSQIWYAPIGYKMDIGWLIEGENKIDITTYPDVSDPSKRFAFAGSCAETRVSWSAEIVGVPEPVPEPATILLLGLALIGLAGIRKRMGL